MRTVTCLMLACLAGSARAGSLEDLIGPVTPMGTSPWGWYDVAEQALADTIFPAALATNPGRFLGKPLPCKVGFKAHPAQITGDCLAAELKKGEMVVVAWNTVDGPGTGRYIAPVSEVGESAAKLTYWDLYPAEGEDLTVYHCGDACHRADEMYQPHFWGLNQQAGNNNWNYYDTCLAAYRLHARTGDDKYREFARDCADIWWEWGIDHGSMSNFRDPRTWSFTSQFLRALDGKPERLPALFATLKRTIDDFGFDNIAAAPFFDSREAGYLQAFVAMGWIADTDEQRRARYCEWMQTWAGQWIRIQDPRGFFPDLPYNYPIQGPGASPWRQDIPIRGLQYTYDIVSNSANSCHDAELAEDLFATIRAAVDFTYVSGRSSTNRGVYYNVFYPTAQEWTDREGKVSVALGSNEVVGTATRFRREFKCNGTDFIAFRNSGRNGFAPFLVKSCQDDTHLTLDEPYGGSGQKESLADGQYATVPMASQKCGTAEAAYCWSPPEYTGGAPNGDRNLNRLLPAIHGWMWAKTWDPKYLEWGDELFSAAYGGPAGGPGSRGKCGGPKCDGTETDYVGALPSCSRVRRGACNGSADYPGGNVTSYLGKNYGQGSGFGGADNFLGYRAMKPPQP